MGKLEEYKEELRQEGLDVTDLRGIPYIDPVSVTMKWRDDHPDKLLKLIRLRLEAEGKLTDEKMARWHKLNRQITIRKWKKRLAERVAVLFD